MNHLIVEVQFYSFKAELGEIQLSIALFRKISINLLIYEFYKIILNGSLPDSLIQIQ